MTRRTTHPTDPRRRIIALLVVFCLVGVAYIGSLVDLQTVRPERYRGIGEDQRTRAVSLAGYRGTVHDRNGAVLAVSMPGRQLVADPQLVDDPTATATVLGPVLGVDPTTLIDELTPASAEDRYGELVDSIDDETLARFLEVRENPATADLVSGIAVVPVEERVYPAETLARPVVGVVDEAEDGQYGVEWQYDESLQGHEGVERYERSVFGAISVGERSIEPPTPGDDVYLTIDENIQYVVEQALIEHCQDTLANSAQAVVSHPRTGEILAMATVIRAESGECVVPIYNAPLVDTFEPGSVLKLVTAAAAVEELGYTADTTFDVPNSIMVVDKEFVEPHEHEVAPYPVEQIIAQSMNVGTIMMAQAVGPERLEAYLRAFGFGQQTGLGFKDEAAGTVRPWSEWMGSDQGSIPIGQGMTSNTVQLAMAYNTIANDGIYLAPRLIRSIVAQDGTERTQPAQVSRRVLSPESAREVNRMLQAVVDPTGIGTGTAAAVPGYTVAGKTGTAWKLFRDDTGTLTYGDAGSRRYVVTFAGFLPADDPQLSIVVVVDEPRTETTAGLVAAPVFADIAHYVVRILGIAPEHDDLAVGELVRGTPAVAPAPEPPVDPAAAVVPVVDGAAVVPEPDETVAADGSAPTEGGG